MFTCCARYQEVQGESDQCGQLKAESQINTDFQAFFILQKHQKNYKNHLT
jgi:hypothetical protein